MIGGPALAVAAGLAFVVALAVIPLIRRIAVDRELLDAPGGRKTHAEAVPRLGGAAMVIAFLLGTAAALALEQAGGSPAELPGLAGLLFGVVAVSAIGLVDDLRPLGATVKLVGQLIAAAGAVALGLQVSEVAMPWGVVELGPVGPVLTLLWLVGAANAINLLDGLDGLAGGVSLTAIGAYAAIAALVQAPMPLLVLAGAAGSVVAFLFYNRPPASIFMGDTGSMFLGFALGGTAVALVAHAPERVSVLALALALALPIADTAYVIVRRVMARQSVFAPDNRHIHYRLAASPLSSGQVVLLLVGASGILAMAAVLVTG